MISKSNSLTALMASLRQQRRVVAIIGVLFFIVLLWYISKPWSDDVTSEQFITRHPLKYGSHLAKSTKVLVHEYNYKIDIKQSWFISNCLKTEDSDKLKIENFPKLIQVLQESSNSICKEASDLFQSIYSVRESLSEVVINKVFAQKVLKWFGGNKDLLKETKRQHVLFITNIITQESTVINPLRAKRPGAGAVGPEVKIAVEELIKTSSKDCDFCNYKTMTARDPFGSIDSKYSVTVANTFKIEKFHGLILWKHHNPMNFSEDQVLDVLDVAQKWFAKAHETDNDFEYPHIYWDALTKASASQIHPHIHLSLASGQYYSGWARIHESAVAYAKSHNGANYFKQLVKIHSLFGLAVQLGEATALAYLTPIGSHEVMLISKQPCKDLFRLLFYVMRAFIDDMSLYATSMGMVFPKMVTQSSSDLPTLIQFVYRGSQTSARSDISSFDLFGTHNVNVDPYNVIRSIRKTMMKYGAL